MSRFPVPTAASAWSRQQNQFNPAASTSAVNFSASWSGYDQYVTGMLFLIPGCKVSSSLAGQARSIFGGGKEQKRLRFIRSVFPYEDSTQIPNIEDIYAEALGYFRFVIAKFLFVRCFILWQISSGSHCEASKMTIAHLFLTQIRTGHCHHLQITLNDLSTFEKQHCLAMIMTACMNDIENL